MTSSGPLRLVYRLAVGLGHSASAAYSAGGPLTIAAALNYCAAALLRCNQSSSLLGVAVIALSPGWFEARNVGDGLFLGRFSGEIPFRAQYQFCLIRIQFPSLFFFFYLIFFSLSPLPKPSQTKTASIPLTTGATSPSLVVSRFLSLCSRSTCSPPTLSLTPLPPPPPPPPAIDRPSSKTLTIRSRKHEV